MVTPVGKKREQQKYYKLYEGVRCVLSIIPAKVRKQANIEAGDYISFEYNEEHDFLILKIKRA